jgi:CelD/BcsL family acetyltransferase involved in cellulose biosynthesis
MFQRSIGLQKPETSDRLELITGDDALAQLDDAEFLTAWEALYNSCPWATVYQSKEFVLTWYKIYHKDYLPIIITAFTDGDLTGLLTLARDKNRVIGGAGLDQAEYHVWLSKFSNKDSFVKNALFNLRKLFPESVIQFRFIPGNTPLTGIENILLSINFVLQPYNQPLMVLDKANLSQELRKKSRKEKINRLKKIGELKFERITDYQTFHYVFDELAAQYDFRKGAMYNITPFRQDPLKKKFLLDLFRQNLLHATILKVNEQIIASNVGTIGKSCIHLQGINTHCPSYARYSPGTLQMLMLGVLLAEEGFETFDLTPGGDSYKDGLATTHDVAYELRIAGGKNSYVSRAKKNFFYQFVRNKKKILTILARMGVTSKDLKVNLRKAHIVKEKFQKAKELGLRYSVGNLSSIIKISKALKIYKIEPREVKEIISIKKNNLHDLLAYQSTDLRLTKWEFLIKATEKLGRAQRVYSFAKENLLSNAVWLKEYVIKDTTEIDSENRLPDGALILHDFYYHPMAEKNIAAFIMSVSTDIFNSYHKPVYAVIPDRDKPICKALTDIGFKEIQIKVNIDY